MKQQIDTLHLPNLPTIVVETINVSGLQSRILEVVSRAQPLKSYGSEMNGRPGLTATRVCVELGRSGSEPEVYEALAELHELGLLKRSEAYPGPIYYM